MSLPDNVSITVLIVSLVACFFITLALGHFRVFPKLWKVARRFRQRLRVGQSFLRRAGEDMAMDGAGHQEATSVELAGALRCYKKIQRLTVKYNTRRNRAIRLGTVGNQLPALPFVPNPPPQHEQNVPKAPPQPRQNVPIPPPQPRQNVPIPPPQPEENV